MNRVEWSFRVLQIVNLLILAGWAASVVAALMHLRRGQMDEVARVLWALMVVLVPVVGALALLIVRPGQPRKLENEGGQLGQLSGRQK